MRLDDNLDHSNTEVIITDVLDYVVIFIVVMVVLGVVACVVLNIHLREVWSTVEYV